MLCYWILKRPDGKPAGHVRVENDRVLLTLTVPVEGTFTLFSDADAVPLPPGTETVFPGAIAVLGTSGDRTTAFAAAEGAAPLAQFRARLSHIRTIKNKQPAETVVSAPPEGDISRYNTTQTISATDDPRAAFNMHHIRTSRTDSITDSAREAQSFSVLLQRADAFFAAYESDPTDAPVGNLVQNMDRLDDRGIDLFSQEYPGARWRYIDGTDVLPHYEGTWKQPNGPTLHILAVRGRAAPRPPRALLGFTRFLRDRDGTGYWLRLTPLP